MKKISRPIINAILTALVAALPFAGSAQAAGTPSLYFAQSNVSANSNNNFSLPLRLNADGQTINAVGVTVNFPESQLSFVGLNNSGSYFDSTLPSTPTAKNGKLEFSVAKLGGSTTGDVLVSQLVFHANASSGLAQIGLNGSQAANDGKDIGLTTTGVNVQLAPGTGAGSKVNISNVQVSNVVTNGATISWQTSIPTTGSVAYGATKFYGLNSGDASSSVSHKVNLNPVFAGDTTVYYKITSVDASGDSASSTGSTFKTAGYNIQIKVENKKGQVLSGASVSVSGSKAAKTNADGLVSFSNIASGGQKVRINGAAAQPITVKSVRGTNALNVQDFNLTANSSRNDFLYVISAIIVVLILLGAATEIYIHHNKTTTGTPAA